MLYRVLLIPRVDAFGAIACEKVLVEFEAGDLLNYRYAVIFGYAWVHGALIYYNIALGYNLANGGTRTDKGG